MTKEDIKRQQPNMLKKLVARYGELVTSRFVWQILLLVQNGE